MWSYSSNIQSVTKFFLKIKNAQNVYLFKFYIKKNYQAKLNCRILKQQERFCKLREKGGGKNIPGNFSGEDV